MEARPVIGLITQVQETLTGEGHFAIVTNQQYFCALEAAGAAPQRIPLLHEDEARLRPLYDEIDGLCLTGGADMDPAHYGEERHPRCEPGDVARDCTEMTLYRWAREDGKPIFGICRGLQVMNVAAGGTLFQDLASQRPATIKHDYFSAKEGHPRDLLVHDVEMAPGSRLEQILEVRQVRVNSMHHQSICRLAPGLHSTAFAPDGVIEGVESTDGRFVLGVQWHPEELTENVPLMRRLFVALARAAGEYRSGVRSPQQSPHPA